MSIADVNYVHFQCLKEESPKSLDIPQVDLYRSGSRQFLSHIFLLNICEPSKSKQHLHWYIGEAGALQYKYIAKENLTAKYWSEVGRDPRILVMGYI